MRVCTKFVIVNTHTRSTTIFTTNIYNKTHHNMMGLLVYFGISYPIIRLLDIKQIRNDRILIAQM